MPLNGYPITGMGETCTQEMAAPGPGTPLPSRPARAAANNAKRWKPPPFEGGRNADENVEGRR